MGIEWILLNQIRVNVSNGCWEWTGKTWGGNYGYVWYRKKTLSAHRVSAEVFLGFDVFSKLLVCHECDNPPCINPNHFFVGTQDDNMKDMAKKRRSPRVWLGRKHTEETKRKMSTNNKRAMLGKKMSMETRKKQSKAQILRYANAD